MSFIPRLNTDNMSNNAWWYSNGNLLYNAGYGLPNCTCYAYGRYAEIRNAFARLPTSNAGKWYEQATSFERGLTPKLGAVMCWKDTQNPSKYAGHVAIVEQITTDGSIICSNSAWKGTYFWTAIVNPPDYRMSWMTTNGRHYGFQGFIYNDTADTKPDTADITEPSLASIPLGQWHAVERNGFARTSNEAWGNACRIYWLLREATSIELPSGWTLNAICAVLGNIEKECDYNPWQWESNNILSTTSSKIYNSSGPGYGLLQFTPAADYLKNSSAIAHSKYAPHYSNSLGSPDDGEAQIYVMNTTTGVPATQQWYSTSAFTSRYTGGTQFTGMSWTDFRSSKLSPEELTLAFAVCYERPAYQPGTKSPYWIAQRQEAARYWYNKFTNYTSSDTPKNPEKPVDTDNPVVVEVDTPENPGPTNSDEIDVDNVENDPFIIVKPDNFMMIRNRTGIVKLA